MLRLPPSHFRPDESYTGGYDAHFGRDARHRVAEQLAGEHGLQLVAEWPMQSLGVDCFVMEVPSNDSPAHLVKRLSSDPRIESVQPMNLFHTLGYNDPLYSLQPSAKLWHLAELHEVTTGRNVMVAEVDTGVDLDHPDLRGQVAVVQNFVDDSPYVAETHGTAVAGIIVARADNGLGIAGVAPQARLMVLRACWQVSAQGAALCSSFTLAKALQFALDHNAQIINLSLGGPRDRLLERLLDMALMHGVTIVSAVDPRVGSGGFPASHAGVLAVAGDDERNVAADVLVAPGRDIPTTIPGGRWDFVTGSSFAAAHVTGLVALLLELEPRIQPQQVHDALISAGTSGASADRPTMVDACAAVARAVGACACGCAVAHATRSLPYR
ncbi:MAG: S8 family peptidase [Sulfuricaulis sp.]